MQVGWSCTEGSTPFTASTRASRGSARIQPPSIQMQFIIATACRIIFHRAPKPCAPGALDVSTHQILLLVIKTSTWPSSHRKCIEMSCYLSSEAFQVALPLSCYLFSIRRSECTENLASFKRPAPRNIVDSVATTPQNQHWDIVALHKRQAVGMPLHESAGLLRIEPWNSAWNTSLHFTYCKVMGRCFGVYLQYQVSKGEGCTRGFLWQEMSLQLNTYSQQSA